MRDIKSVVYSIEGRNCTLMTLREGDNGEQFVTANDITLKIGQNVLYGQEVDVKYEKLPDHGDTLMPVVYDKNPPKMGDMKDQSDRLNNLKEMMEISLRTDSSERLIAEREKMGDQDANRYFEDRYANRIYKYQNAVDEIIKESYAKDREGYIDITDEEDDRRQEVHDIFQKIMDVVNVVKGFPFDKMISSIKDYNDRTEAISKYFASAVDAIQFSHDLQNDNNDNYQL